MSNQLSFQISQPGPSILSNQKWFHIIQLRSIPNIPTEYPCPYLSSQPVPSQAKFHHSTPATRLLNKYTQRTPSHIMNLQPILFSHQHSFHLLHPYSISHMGYTRPFWWPHGSHCTRHQAWIPLLVPVLDAVMDPVVRKG